MSRLLTSTEAAHELGVGVMDLDQLDLHPVIGDTGTRRYTDDDIEHVLHPPALDRRDHRHLAVACGGGAIALAALITWAVTR